MIETSFCHPSLRRIFLSKSSKPHSNSTYKTSTTRLIFPNIKFVYVSDDFHGEKIHQLRYKTYHHQQEPIEHQYHVRCLDLMFTNWCMDTLIDLLSCLPLLVELKIIGYGHLGGWLLFYKWDRMLQKLKALQRVTIDIYIYYPISTVLKKIQEFNEEVSQAVQTCKRINLTFGMINQIPGWFQFSASLNMV